MIFSFYAEGILKIVIRVSNPCSLGSKEVCIQAANAQTKIRYCILHAM